MGEAPADQDLIDAGDVKLDETLQMILSGLDLGVGSIPPCFKGLNPDVVFIERQKPGNS